MTEVLSIDTLQAKGDRTESVLSVRAILRNSSKISGANLLNALLLFPVNILVARVLGPELLGVVGYVVLWQLYASLSKPGMFQAAYREIPPLLAQGKIAEATRVQNIGVTGDALYLLLPTILMLVMGLFQNSILLRNGLIVGAFVFGISQVREFAAQLQWANQRFDVIAKTNLVVAIVSAAFVLSTIGWLGVYSPLLLPGVATVTLLICYRLWGPRFGFRPMVDLREMYRLLRIGLPLGLLSILYWGFRTVDRAAVANWLTLTDLGYFTFVMQFINLAILLVADFGNVLQPTLWAELGRGMDWQSLGPKIRRLSLIILGVTCAGANFAQAGFGAFVHWFVPRFEPAVTAFEVLAFLLACSTAGIVPLNLLTSVAVNRQKLAAAIYAVGVPLNIGLAYLAVRSGWGISGIAVSSVFAQAFISVILLYIVRGYFLQRRAEYLSFYGSMVGLLVVALSVFIAYHIGLLSFVGSDSIVEVLVLRLVLACLVWGSIAGGAVYWHRRRSAADLAQRNKCQE